MKAISHDYDSYNIVETWLTSDFEYNVIYLIFTKMIWVIS